MTKTGSIAFILKKDRFVVLIALFILCVLSWLYIIYLYNQMYPMDMDAFLFAMPMTSNWSWTDFVLLFLMWFVMMIAMMTPSVAPLVLIFTSINRKRRQQQNPFATPLPLPVFPQPCHCCVFWPTIEAPVMEQLTFSVLALSPCRPLCAAGQGGTNWNTFTTMPRP